MSPDQALPLPERPNLENSKKIAKGLVKSGKHATLAKAQFELARTYGFQSWPKFASHLREIARNSPVSRFEAAVDAIVEGNIDALAALLRADPELVHARSTRRHAATLLIYAGANGVEHYRQKTPPNILAIVDLLLDAGAEVDATADLYGAPCTTLELAATSIYPLRAGVQNELLQKLLDRGASIDRPNLLPACLGNFRPQAAAFLAARGAKIDLIGAAGLGDLETTRRLYDDATPQQKHFAIMWASEYGRNDVIEFLLSKGADLTDHTGDGQTPLHWAIIGGQLETVKLLLRHHPPLDAKNMYGGTPVGQAQWSVENGGDPQIYKQIFEALREAGAK